MCGIIGILNIRNNNEVLEQTIASLKRLEYRGYDSSGVAVSVPTGIERFRAVGKIQNLEAAIVAQPDAYAAIAHTRWATHGKATQDNAHPHQSQSGRITLVHNGTIENYLALKEHYLADVTLTGETDTEVVANVLAYFIEKDELTMEKAIARLIAEVDGSYALVISDVTEPEVLYFAKNKSPLILGQNQDSYFIASDMLAIETYTNEFMEITDLHFGSVSRTGVHVFDKDGQAIPLAFIAYEISESRRIDKGEFPHFMMKEIHEQPNVLRQIANRYTSGVNFTFDDALLHVLKNASQINVIAAGTSYHAGLVISNLVKKHLHKESLVYIASEFTYGTSLIHKDAVYLFFSQSGETADSRAALQRIKKEQPDAAIVTVTNVVTSTLAREADFVLDIHAGVEIAVASTKAYVAQIAVVTGVIYAVAGLSAITYAKGLEEQAVVIETILQDKDAYLTYAHDQLHATRNAFYIGRQMGYALSVEAALKLKEISYIQTEGFAAGELKHGTIALIEEGTPVLAFITDKKTAGLTRSNIEEVKARGAHTFVVTTKAAAHAGDQVILETENEDLLPLAMIVPAQLIAYYAAIVRGCDVDMPRNLAKSVTVE